MNKKGTFTLLVFGFILIVFIVGITFYIFSSSQVGQPASPSVTPAQSSILLEPQTLPPVSYNSSAQDKLLEKFTKRTPLSDADKAAKLKILSLLPEGERSGVLFKSVDVSIDYAFSPDDLQGEILTTNIQGAKAEAISWLRSQGMSQKGICDLPFSFYLNFQAAEQLRSSNIIFNPLPDEC